MVTAAPAGVAPGEPRVPAPPARPAAGTRLGTPPAVRRTLLVHRAGATDPERRQLDAPCSAGGSRSDSVLLEGLAPAALRLEPCAAGVVIEAAVAGVRVAGRPVPPGGRRLLRPGQRASLHGLGLELPADRAPASGTRAVAAGLLRQASDGAAPPAGPHLLVLTGPAAGERLALGAVQTLGRSRRADLRLPDPGASRLHARLRVGPAGVTVEDLGAKNGLRVNGIPVDARMKPLRSGDELELGGTSLALVLPDARGARPEAVLPVAVVGAAVDEPPRRGADVRRATAALLALSALALALAGT